jgi:hypothetical protein
MIESEPMRLRLDPETEPAVRLALLDSADELPSEEELAALRLALTPRVGEPTRLKQELGSPLARALPPLELDSPSVSELRALRERLPQPKPSAMSRRPKPRAPRRAAVTALAWLVPFAAAAAAAGYLLRDRPKPEPAPIVSQSPALSPPVVPTVTVAPVPSSAPPPAPSSSARLNAHAGSATSDAPKVSELDLMRDAKAALPVDPNQALSILNRHARLYPSGVLAQEREVLAIDALLRLGRKSEASGRAARFSSNYPASAHWPHIQRLLSNAGL